jgi:6-phosphogluconate dehydrogenase
MTEKAQIGVTGLAVMGRNLARNFARHGHTVALHNRSYGRTKELVESYGHEGTFIPSESAEDFVASLERPRRVVIMVKAGKATDAVIDEFAPLLEEGDMLIDAGNAHFADTRRREAALKERGLHFVGTGVSGGEEGALHGPSIMPGGSKESYESLGPLLEDIAAKVDGEPCCVHVGPDGAGHFVKMVHNGIEYADMQLIAEAYDLLRSVGGHSPAEIAEIFKGWNEGRLGSYLIEITAEVLKQTDAETGQPFIDIVVDQAEQKGTGRWTVQAALDLGVPVSGIAEGGADLQADVEQALFASKIVAYAQGFQQIQAASAEYGWDIDPGQMAKIWRAGCIIRAKFLDFIKQAYDKSPDLPSLLVDEYFLDAVSGAQEAWRRVVATAAQQGIPAPGFASALAYYDGLRARRLPAALIQGQRDFFGAHTYRRVDKDGSFHTMWGAERNEVSA